MNTAIVEETKEASPQAAALSPKWRERLQALRKNSPLLFKMVWESAPGVVVGSLSARVIASLIPLSMLAVTGTIIEGIHAYTSHQKALPHYFWWPVAAEFVLAALSTVLVRVLDFFDVVLADKFTRHISTRIVEHASKRSASCRRATIRLWEVASKARWTSPAASGRRWRWLAAYLRDAQVLILDEPTAALDARSEHEVFERFAELTKGKMSLLISHRFSTVRMADRILVLEGGKIAEQGKHDDLVRESGRYAQMFELQAANYR